MKDKTVASKLNWLIILSVVISLLISSIMITTYLLHRFKAEVIEKDELHMKGLTSSVKGFIEHAFTLNSLLSTNPEIIENVASADKDWNHRVSKYNSEYDTSSGLSDNSGFPLLVKTQGEYDFVELFFVQDAAGNQTARSFGPLGHRGNRWWFKKIIEGHNYRPFISKAYYSMTEDKPVASAFHPIYKGNKFIGIMGTDINFIKLQNMVESYLNSQDLYAIVVDNEGSIIAHPDKSKLREMYDLKKLTKNVLITDVHGETIQDKSGYHKTKEVKLDWDPAVPLIISEALNGKSGIAENIILSGKNCTLYYDPVPLPGKNDKNKHYSLILIRDNSSITKTKLAICVFVSLFTVLTIFVLIFLVRSQFRRTVLTPLKTLTTSMRDADIANPKEVELQTNDEFQMLADTYNDMRKNLAKANQQLSELNKELDNRVNERTAELSGVNEQLKQQINERKLTDERYRFLVENTIIGYAILDPSSGRFLFGNQRLRELFGYTLQETLELSLWDTIVPEEHEIFKERLGRLKDGTLDNEPHVYTVLRKDGSTLKAEVSASLVNFQGKTVVQALIRDVTEQKRLEQQLHQAHKMEAIGTLAGGIAHDFNNLLMGIQGNTSLVLLDVDSEHPHYEKLKNIEKYIQSGAELTKQLLGFARGGKYEVSSVDLNNLINKTSEMFGRTKKEIAIKRNLQKDIWAVEVDQSQIEEVLVGLYMNAAQAMPDGGELHLQTRNITLDHDTVKPFEVEPGKYVRVSIIDTGTGMDEATMQRLFDPFFTTMKMGRGKGLGLASAYGIINNHGGFINVKSRVDKCSTFEIHLPASEKAIVKETAFPDDVLKGTETILLVDDEEMIIDVGVRILEEMGYNGLLARNGEEALEVYKKNLHKIDMVILDMIMPDMSGGVTYDRLKEINPGIKVLLSSGYSIDGQATQILGRGCNGFIQKPYNIKQLSRKIRAILDTA